MAIYIALFRGINVGANKRIKMDLLNTMFESLGYREVETYIQSGNVIFEAAEEEIDIITKLESAIQETFGFSADIIIRKAEELEALIRNCPFSKEELTVASEANLEGESFYLALMSKEPSVEKLELIKKYKTDMEEYQLIGRSLYLLIKYSVRNSKLANNLTKLDAKVTVRNWNTIQKLNELSKSKGQR